MYERKIKVCTICDRIGYVYKNNRDCNICKSIKCLRDATDNEVKQYKAWYVRNIVE